MIKVSIRRQLNADPIIEFFKNDVKIDLKPENLNVMQNSTTFEIDVNLKRGRKNKKV